MNNNFYQGKQPVPASIKVVSIIDLVFKSIGILISVLLLVFEENIINSLKESGINVQGSSNNTMSFVLLVFQIIAIIGMAMILKGKKIGIILYFAYYLLYFCYLIIFTQFSIGTLIGGFTLPVLMIIFVARSSYNFE